MSESLDTGKSLGRILLLGVGNTLLGDEGFGVHALRYLDSHYEWPKNVRLLDGGTLGLLLLGELLETDLAIILDIALGGHPPGTFYALAGEQLSSALNISHSLHQTSIEDVLITCDLAGHRPRTLIYAMEPYGFQTMRPQLTEHAEEKLPVFCQKVLAELAKEGISPVASKNPPHQ